MDSAGEAGGGLIRQAPDHFLPPVGESHGGGMDLLEASALGAIYRWPEARRRADELGGVAVLFREPEALDAALEAMGEPDAMGLDADGLARSIEMMELAADFTPTDPVWGVYVIERLSRERSALLLTRTLEWGRAELDAGGAVGNVARVVGEAFRMAGVACG